MNDAPTGQSEDPGREPTEEELRAALEAEMKRINPDDVLLQTIVSLVNLAGRRIGRAPGTEDERDLEQVHTCIEGVRALLPIVELRHGDQLAPIREALSQLQLAYAQEAKADPGTGAGGEPGDSEQDKGASAGPEGAEAAKDKSAGPAQSSGRLWVPGQ